MYTCTMYTYVSQRAVPAPARLLRALHFQLLIKSLSICVPSRPPLLAQLLLLLRSLTTPPPSQFQATAAEGQVFPSPYVSLALLSHPLRAAASPILDKLSFVLLSRVNSLGLDVKTDETCFSLLIQCFGFPGMNPHFVLYQTYGARSPHPFSSLIRQVSPRGQVHLVTSGSILLVAFPLGSLHPLALAWTLLCGPEDYPCRQRSGDGPHSVLRPCRHCIQSPPHPPCFSLWSEFTHRPHSTLADLSISLCAS